jgi:hypothetical protein
VKNVSKVSFIEEIMGMLQGWDGKHTGRKNLATDAIYVFDFPEFEEIDKNPILDSLKGLYKDINSSSTPKQITEEYIKTFSDGMTLETGEELKSAELEILSENTCYLTISEGKFHQVKRMFAMLGLNVIYLKRISIGGVSLDENLKLGEYRELTSDEVERICLKK